ncbi:Os02g0639500 [Oryza sativa Japonica Group]|uniref:Os02g0639500 protein n=1 Tax=Oryza sativa subsp. japonica TaxID=39947 RepID=C7IY81_ORYSJ|nr:Os02g0639500 [Oryza sativa Japonica Group]|eukprot:NP_001173093.1 Os02g0639500 [Oryza sativa Japonica Group]
MENAMLDGVAGSCRVHACHIHIVRGNSFYGFTTNDSCMLTSLSSFFRTACKYGGKNIAFHVNEGSTTFWLSLLVEFEDGDGDIGSMQLKQVKEMVQLDCRQFQVLASNSTASAFAFPIVAHLHSCTHSTQLA